jgi:hypothetical protein
MQQQIFYCTSETGKVNDKHWVYIQCDRWFDARKVAYTLFGTDAVQFKSVDSLPTESVHQGNFYRLQWVGSPMDPANQPELKVIPWETAVKPLPPATEEAPKKRSKKERVAEK